jgi:hypothetical protein
MFFLFISRARFILYTIYTAKDTVGLNMWGSSKTILEKVKMQLLFIVVREILQSILNRGSTW